MKMKPIIDADGYYVICPNCLTEAMPGWDCPNCLQELDWSWLHIHIEDNKFYEE